MYIKSSILKNAIKFLIFALIIELFSGYFYFQRSWEKGVATNWVYSRVMSHLGYEETISTSIPKQQYINNIYNWISEAKKMNISVALLYIPMAISKKESKREFFKLLAQQQGIDFIDTKELLSEYKSNWIYNLPSDAHLTRLGHILVAKYVQSWLWNKSGYFSKNIDSIELNQLKGPHPPSVNQVRLYQELAYHIETNSYGFRMSKPITQDNSSVVLMLGDSFTFGTGVNTVEAYPNILNQLFTDSLIVNAGLPGAGLEDELMIYRKFILAVKPQVVILQVLDNDVEL